MKLSRMRGERRARMICRLAEPLAALGGAFDADRPFDGAAWSALVLSRNAEALQVVSMLTGWPLPMLRRMGDGLVRRILRRTLDGELLELLVLVRQVGSGAVMAAVCQCGAPPTIRALAAWLAQEDSRLSWRHYTAEMLWLTARSVHSGGEIPRYSQLLRAGEASGTSGQDTAQALAAALRRKGANQHEAV